MAEFILIPEPTAEDADAVVTALETAAVFGHRGDRVEALRWLKRAAESSSEYGDDYRTLTLARAAADLMSQLPRYDSTSPSRSMAPNGAGASARPHANGSAGTPSMAPHANGSVSTPSVAPHANGSAGTPSMAPHANGSVVPSTPPGASGTAPSRSPNPVSADGQKRLPKPPSRPNSIRPAPDAEVSSSKASAAPSLRPPPPSARAQSSVPPPLPQQASPGISAPSPSQSGTNGDAARGAAQSFRPPQMSPEIRTVPEHGENEGKLESSGMRAAARVSVKQNGAPGVYIVRVLEEGEAAEAPAVEAFLVLSDPNARIRH